MQIIATLTINRSGSFILPETNCRRSVPLLTRDEVRPIAANTAKLPWLQKRRDGLEKDEAGGATPGFSA
jgi:hypothetical protein